MDELLNEIRDREYNGEFNYGILPADLYVKSMEQICGTEICYKTFSKNQVSFSDAVKIASKKLTYNNPEMVVQDVYTDFKSKVGDLNLGEDFELPKNTLMVFKHILTTPRKDRDGDIMRTQGAKPDPKMLLLWQHVHTLPIGKMLSVVRHDSKALEVISAIIDMNDLSHDAAVMIDNKMGRFSHGFKAKEFTKIKSLIQMDDLETVLGIKFSDEEREKAKQGKASGFDVTEFEIMEESLVSVPANVDAETQEVYLSLIEGKQLRSGLMKSFGQTIRAGMAKQIPVNIDLKVSLNGKSISGDEDEKPESEKGGGEECSCGGSGPPKQKRKPESTKEEQVDSEDKKMMCPECGGKMENGVCKKCGYKKKEGEEGKEEEEEKDFNSLIKGLTDEQREGIYEELKKSFDGESQEGQKAGRVLSKSNYDKLVDVRDDMKEMYEGQLVTTRSGQALCKGCMMKLTDVIDSAKMDSYGQEVDKDVELTAKQAMAIFLQKSTEDERDRMSDSLEALQQLEIKARKRETLEEFFELSQG